MLESFFLFMLGWQFIHSVEEVLAGFHKKFPLFRMSLGTFIFFEVLFQGLFWIVNFTPLFPYRAFLMGFFVVLMFANGLWHMVWWGIEKGYVPGLITAPMFVVVFLIFYFQVLF